MANKDDSLDLEGFGYRQELDRSLGSFSSFAAGFSYISILTGVFQTFYLGFDAGGPGFVWTWPLVFLGQFLVALGFAELAANYPLSGGVYQWAKLVGSPALGWFTGWLYLCCLVVTLSAVALALQTALPQISPSFQFFGSAAVAGDAMKNSVLLGSVLIVFSTALNSVGVRTLARVNNLGVFTELLGVILLVVLLGVHGKNPPSEALFTTGGRGGGAGYFPAFLAAAALTASYVMYGFDTAGSLAEETENPRQKAPRAILQALGAAGAAGFLLLVTALLAANKLSAPELGMQSGGLPWIVKGALGERLGLLFLCDVVFAMTVCALAVHSGAVRLAYAMSRDGTLPLSRALSEVSATSHTPVLPAILVGALAITIIVANVNVPKLVELTTMVSVLWANLAYCMVTGALLLRRLRGSSSAPLPGIFTLGKWGVPINGLAFGWSIFMVVNVGWPRAEIYGAEARYRFAPILLTAMAIALGGLVRWAAGRPAKARLA